MLSLLVVDRAVYRLPVSGEAVRFSDIRCRRSAPSSSQCQTQHLCTQPSAGPSWVEVSWAVLLHTAHHIEALGADFWNQEPWFDGPGARPLPYEQLTLDLGTGRGKNIKNLLSRFYFYFLGLVHGLCQGCYYSSSRVWKEWLRFRDICKATWSLSGWSRVRTSIPVSFLFLLKITNLL